MAVFVESCLAVKVCLCSCQGLFVQLSRVVCAAIRCCVVVRSCEAV